MLTTSHYGHVQYSNNRCRNFWVRSNMWHNSIIIVSWSPADVSWPAKIVGMQMQTIHSRPTWIVWHLQYLYKYSQYCSLNILCSPFKSCKSNLKTPSIKTDNWKNLNKGWEHFSLQTTATEPAVWGGSLMTQEFYLWLDVQSLDLCAYMWLNMYIYNTW